jgi:xylitol oxidase
VFVGLAADAFDANFDNIMSSGYSVSLFTAWDSADAGHVWVKRRVGEAAGLDLAALGATRAASERHPIADASTAGLTQQGGVPGPSHARLPHFRLDHTPSFGDELQSEYFVPRRHAVAALRAVRGLREQIAPHLLISEVRSVAADGLWMSMCYGEASVGIHFTWKPAWDAVRGVLPRIEAVLAPFGARPHWGKLFTMAPETVRRSYPRLADFQALARALDPAGKLCNELVERYVLGA